VALGNSLLDRRKNSRWTKLLVEVGLYHQLLAPLEASYPAAMKDTLGRMTSVQLLEFLWHSAAGSANSPWSWAPFGEQVEDVRTPGP